MKRSLPDMMSDRLLGASRNPTRNGSEITVLERQRAHVKFLQQPQQSSTSEIQNTIHEQAQKIEVSHQILSLASTELGSVMMINPSLESPEYGHFSVLKEGLVALDETFSRGILYRKAMLENIGDHSVVTAENSNWEIVKESLKTRKADMLLQPTDQFVTESIDTNNLTESCTINEESNITSPTEISKSRTNKKRESSIDTSKENLKNSEVKKTEYIHVRARRGQATDSHSLAERVRREKISQRMKFLQDLVPGCNRITGKAGMLDEIINYVQSLQGQVEFLSMKLASATTAVNFHNDNIPTAEVLTENEPSYHAGSAPDTRNHFRFPSNQIQASTVLETAVNSSDATRFLPMQSVQNWDAGLQVVPSEEYYETQSKIFQLQPLRGESTSMSNQFTMF